MGKYLGVAVHLWKQMGKKKTGLSLAHSQWEVVLYSRLIIMTESAPGIPLPLSQGRGRVINLADHYPDALKAGEVFPCLMLAFCRSCDISAIMALFFFLL